MRLKPQKIPSWRRPRRPTRNVTRRQFGKNVLAVAISALLPGRGWSRNPRGMPNGTTAQTNYLGMNLAGVAYYTSEIPFLNLMKQGGGNQNVIPTGWFTNTSYGSGDLVVDANGYPKSLTGISGTAYTYAGIYVLVNVVGNAPTQTYPFPVVPYTFQFTGKGTIQITGAIGSITSITNTGSGTSTYSGTTITSPTTGTTTVTFTTTNSTIGFTIKSTAIPDSANYPRAMAFVESDLWSTAIENGGTEMFHPLLKSYLTELGVDRLRFMDWGSTNNQQPGIIFTGQVNAGATSATLASAWQNPTNTYNVLFQTGQTIACGFTCGDTNVTFGTAVSTTITYPNSYTAVGWYNVNQAWANRSNWGDASYCTNKGVPVEVMLQLCNELNVDAWLCVPASADSTYITGMANLAYNGTGSTIPGFTGLKPSLKCYVEFSNEVWNSSFSAYHVSNVLGPMLLPAAESYNAPQEWYGVQTAAVADAWYAVYGSAFASRVVVSMGGQFAGGNGPYYMAQAMNAPDWVALGNTAPYTHHIGAYHFAPYFTTAGNGYGASAATSITFTLPPTGTSGVLTAVLAAGTYLVTFSDNEVRQVVLGTASTNISWTGALTGSPTTSAVYGDIPAILASSNPLNTFFAMAYSNVYQGLTYPSVPSNGFMGSCIQTATTSVIGSITGQVWGPGGASALPILGYESGSSWVSGSGETAWLNLITSAHRDARMALLHYDPTNQLYLTYGYTAANDQPGYLPAMISAGFTSLNYFNDCGGITQYGEWGCIESVMQTITPITSAPYKAQGLANWIAA